MSGAAALRAMLASALTQALASASEIADGAGTPEHLHQCRIGLRRLRSALRDFAFLAGAAAPVEAPRWQEQLRELLAVLGRARDRDALAASLLPQLAAAGAPVASLPPLPGPVQDPAVLLRAPAANLLWLAILGWLQASALPPEPAAPALREQVRDRLAKLHRQVLADAVRTTGWTRPRSIARASASSAALWGGVLLRAVSARRRHALPRCPAPGAGRAGRRQ